jgi:hypothetical protein
MDKIINTKLSLIVVDSLLVCACSVLAGYQILPYYVLCTAYVVQL